MDGNSAPREVCRPVLRGAGPGVGQTEATEKEGPEAAEMRKKGPERSERGKEEGGIVERVEEEEEGREEDEPVRGWRPWG